MLKVIPIIRLDQIDSSLSPFGAELTEIAQP